MLSQLLFAREAYGEAVHHAATALDILYQWANCWDKRRSYNQWVGFARMCLMRAKRKQLGLKSLPSQKLADTADPKATEVTFLRDVMKEMDNYTEEETKR